MANYPVGFYFSVIYKDEDTAFKEVSGISKEISTEDVTCGGENRFKYRLPTGASSSKNIILKRAIVTESSSLIDWCSQTLDQGFVNPIQTEDILVYLLNSTGDTIKKWEFHNAYPVSYSVSDLKSQESEIVVETIELAYTYFEVKPSS